MFDIIITSGTSSKFSLDCNALLACVYFSVMVEAFANEVTSERFCEALRFAFREVHSNCIPSKNDVLINNMSQSQGLKKTLIPTCPLDKQLSNFTCPGQLRACQSLLFLF